MGRIARDVKTGNTNDIKRKKYFGFSFASFAPLREKSFLFPQEAPIPVSLECIAGERLLPD